MSFMLYIVGFLVVIGGVAWGLLRVGAPAIWVAIACLVLFGIGISTGVTRTRARDLPKAP
jgi:hypothetical protein